ncbi:ATP-binding protein [Streptomyces sp. NPDC090499]|uniref:ATP-binding protein n=1 Tax=Streptomyces sp. NPDC090499 TaxID=3365965 RepID=UPI0038249CAC
MRPETVDLRLVVTHLSRLLLSSHGQEGVTLATPGLEHQPALVTDETLPVRILRNVVSNALKFTERGEVSLTVTADPESAAPAVLFTVTDTGAGIPSAEIDRVFEAFYQVRGPLQSKRTGTGPGLPYARTLTELLGGALILASQVGVGARVRTRLPDLGHLYTKEPDAGGNEP